MERAAALAPKASASRAQPGAEELYFQTSTVKLRHYSSSRLHKRPSRRRGASSEEPGSP